MPCLVHRRKRLLILAVAVASGMTNCDRRKPDSGPTVVFSRVPAASDGSPDQIVSIEGRVSGARTGQRIVVFALSGMWWVQPTIEQPFTPIRRDSTWKSSTHPGSAYAALLVDAQYRPPLRMNVLPEKGGPVLAVATARGSTPSSPPTTIQFSGYQWETRGALTGTDESPYDPANVWTDRDGCLHLRVTRRNNHWVRAEIKLSRSLGYGSYQFVVRDLSHLEPAAVFAMFTFDDLGPSREMDIEISRWGQSDDKNAQYVIQPYVIPANTIRFSAPAGPLTYWMNWQPGRVTFKTVRGTRASTGSNVVAEHVFTSGVPTTGNETIRMNLYVYDESRYPVQREFEVVIEKFEFLP
jgi:hypothetical protein